MTTTQTTTPLSQVEFSADDFDVAHEIARRLGYEQTAYTSTSALIGLFCLPENPANRPPHHSDARTQFAPYVGGCIIKTTQLGFMFVQDVEDLHFDDLA
jgi:hypothetical protein